MRENWKNNVGGFTRGVVFQVFLYMVLAVSVAVGMVSLAGIAWLADWGAYQNNLTEYQRRKLASEAYEHLSYICSSNITRDFTQVKNALTYESFYYNVRYYISDGQTGEEIWSNASEDVRRSPFVYKEHMYQSWYDRTELVWKESPDCDITLYVDPSFPKEDTLKTKYIATLREYDWRWRAVGVFAVCVSLLFISFIWLLCNAGYRRGTEGVQPGALTNLPLELLTAVFGTGAVGLAGVTLLLEQTERYEVWKVGCFAAGAAMEAVWCTIYLREFALRMKLGKWWRNSLLFGIWRLCQKLLAGGWELLKRLAQGLPLIIHVFLLVCLVSVCEVVGINLFVGGHNYARVFVFWFLEKIFLVPATLYFALAFKRLTKAGEELAQGNLEYKLDMKYLVWDFREHGENLNRIGDGIARAVEQRMRSERLKTELITNVSHDIKTPLTSIINYADLLGDLARKHAEADEQAESRKHAEADEQVEPKEQTEPDGTAGKDDWRRKMTEYSEVLLRQSRRMKKLLEDLLDASKATTGNLEVNLQPCAISVLLSQTLSEYEARFAEKGLRPLVSQPEEEIRIMADGRHLWRVFDNLLNNICKYAQEGSRVYLNVERRENRAVIIFRNMSKYELNVSAEELEERFVRGDASRHMEGSGLGLSIAESLVELQRGTMHIVTDGDLFKVTLEFEMLNSPI